MLINMNTIGEFRSYKEWLVQHPERVNYSLIIMPHLYQYHRSGNETVAAVFGECGKHFRSFLGKVDLN